MKLTVLVENLACGDVKCTHGLSLYIETAQHKILFDAGPDGDLLQYNAEKLGVDLKSIDLAILSHGHYDHAGGMTAFLDINDRAKLYLRRGALLGHYSAAGAEMRGIGADPLLAQRHAGRFVLADEVCRIDDELTLFSDVRTMDLLSGSFRQFFEDGDGAPVSDDFRHEQNLLIRDGGRISLIAGCAHRGIVNIMRRAAEVCGSAPDAVFSGFHLTNPGTKTDEPETLIRAVGEELKARPSLYYTGHCTGSGPYGILKEMLGGRVDYLGCGKTFEVN